MLPSVTPVAGRPLTLTCQGEMSGDVTYEFSRDSIVVQSGSSDTLEISGAATRVPWEWTGTTYVYKPTSGVYQCTATMVDSGDVVTSGSVTIRVIGKSILYWKRKNNPETLKGCPLYLLSCLFYLSARL